jgi:hypothetical protein
MMSEPVFLVGDIVEFHFGAEDRGILYPRYNLNRDDTEYIPNGINTVMWVEGIVTRIDTCYLTTRYIDPSGHERDWSWLMSEHPQYDPKQWEQQGFLRHKKQQQPDRLCSCALDVVMNIGCVCGGG